jgi:predicted DNA-binding transcriptional regulator YafY
MAKADNMLAILWLLISKKRTTASEFAAHLEISVRTVYRYIDALCASGVPIVAEPGHDGGFSLLENFIGTPLFFDSDERKSLFHASMFAKQAGYPFVGSLENALRKIKYQMSPEQVQELEKHTRGFNVVPSKGVFSNEELVQTVEQAVACCNTLTVHYQKKGNSASDKRQIDPYGLVHWNHKWYVVAYCYLRNELRTLRLDRIHNVIHSGETFSRPENFSAADFFLSWLAPNPSEGNLATVSIQGSEEALDYLCNHWYLQHYLVKRSPTIMQFITEKKTLHKKLPELLFPYGESIQIVEPSSLRIGLAELAKKLVRHYELS